MDIKLFATLSLLLLVWSADAKAQKIDEYHLDEVYTIAEGGTIHLNSDDANVQITGSNRSDVHLQVDYRMEFSGFSIGSRDEFEMIVKEQGNNLQISEKDRDFNIIGSAKIEEKQYAIMMEVPKNVSLKIEGDDEQYDISGIGGTIDIAADDTNIQLNNNNGTTFTIKMDDGNLMMNEGSGTLDLDFDDGTVDIDQGNFDEMNVGMDDGNFTMQRAQGTLNIKTDDGNVDINQGDLRGIDVDADDAKISIHSKFYDDGIYRLNNDDGTINLGFINSGGRIEVNHDDPGFNIGSAFQTVSEEDHETIFELQGGNAHIKIDTDKGKIKLRKQ